MKTRFIAARAKPVTEASDSKRLAKIRHQKSQIPEFAGVEHSLQLWQNGQFERHWLSPPVFLLREPEPSVVHVLTPEQNNISPALPCVQEQRVG